MKNFFAILLIIVVVLLIGSAYMFDLNGWSIYPNPLSLETIFVVPDEVAPCITYELKLTTTIFYSKLLWFWERDAVRDSLFVFNSELIKARFNDDYPEYWDSSGRAREQLVPLKHFSIKNFTFDSVSYDLSITRNVGIQTWKEKPSPTSQ